MKYWLLLLTLFLWINPLSAQNKMQLKNEPYSKEWARIDSLMEDNQFPETAQKEIQKIYAKAKAVNQPLQLFKAELYLLRAAQFKSDNDTVAIRKAEGQIAVSTGIDRLIWHSIAAQLYVNYYNDDSYTIMERTTLANASNRNFKEWDAAQFMKVITRHFLNSLDPKAMKVPLSDYAAIVDTGLNTKNLQPTLYDLLAFRALSFFERDEDGMPQPSYKFEMSDANLLSPATTFITTTIKTKDSTSLQLKALEVYKTLLNFHKQDAVPDALIDADIQRIDFLYRNASFPDKKKIYQNTLKALADKYPTNPVAAEARYRYLAAQINNPDIQSDELENAIIKTHNLPSIKKELDALAAQFPGSEGGVHAALLANNIASKALTITAEETVLPDRASRILVKYKNVPQAYFRVVKVDAQKFRHQQRMNRETFYKELLKYPSMQSFESILPATEDFENHSTELKVNALSLGAYAIISSAKNDFSSNDNALSYALFQVTNLALVKTNGDLKTHHTGFVLHRKTGAALPNTSVVFYQAKYNTKTQQYDYTSTPEMKTLEDGSFYLTKSPQNYNGYSLRNGDDQYFSQEYFYTNEYEQPKPVANTRTFFFTDRSIYRPGQTIYFKGIMVKTDADRKNSNVVPNAKTTVTFYDANGQKIKSQDLVTNEFGSVTGSFIAPQGILTGNMTIRNENGEQNISVEEYKRPKFVVSFDTLKGSYGLNEQVTVKGFAKAYAGNNIDGAAVKYTVKRQARWPFWYDWWRPMPYSNEQEITHGTATTDGDGAFNISFLTQPDNSVDSSSLPVFTYSVHVDVTDISGETRSGDQSLSVGYRSLQISAVIPEKAALKALDKLNIRTTNLNGIFVAAKATVKIQKLIEPDFVPRARLWQIPDQFAISEENFRQDFPIDEYKKESKPQAWKAGEEIWSNTFTTTNEGEVSLPKGTIKKNGWYVIEITSADKNGKSIDQKHYVQVYDASLGGKPMVTLSVFQDEDTYEPGETANVHAITSYKQANLLQITTDMINGAQLTQVDVNDGEHNWSKKITEDDRGGMSLQWFMIKNNRVYTADATVAVPWTNKDLHISWETHRDKLQPGAKETWTMKVSGAKKEKVAAEMLAAMYDASLDAFQPHSWNIYDLWPSLNRTMSINAGSGFGAATGATVSSFNGAAIEDYEKVYSRFKGFDVNESNVLYFASPGRGRSTARHMILAEAVPAGLRPTVKFTPPVMKSNEETTEDRKSVNAASSFGYAVSGIPARYGDASGGIVNISSKPKAIVPRKNLQETAFFFPQLKTGAEGSVRFEFTMPEALTEWKFMALAHTKDMQVGQLTGAVKTQKELMVQPNLPRFLRQGDELFITTKISNLSDALLNGTATLEIIDAQTLKSLNLPFRIKENKVSFSVNKNASTTATWKINVPESRYEPVLVRITAQAGDFTDGEENMLPVLTNRTLVTETMPLWMNGTGTKNFSFNKFLHSDSSKTLSQYKVTVEYTANPAWYAVQALPYLMEYPYECAEQTFNRYYANALAAYILDKAPKVKQVFEQWKTIDTSALQSNLQKNQELKSALLEETPWVLEAKDETEQKHNIALLFDSYKLGTSQDAALQKLEDMLLPEGGFPWFKGGTPDRYITQYIATGITRLQHLGVTNTKANDLLNKMVPYLDRSVAADYENLVRSKAKLNEQQIDYTQIQYLYLKSFTAKNALPNTTAFNYYKQQAAKFWPKFNPYIKGMIAISLNRMNDKAAAANILTSLRETSNHSEEMGTYWKQNEGSYYWYQAPIEAQSLLIECFNEANDMNMTNELKRWLLKQKQTQNWSTTKATADACYALLLSGSDWLNSEQKVSIKLGDKTINPSKTEAGTGYFKQTFTAGEVRPEMGNISVTTGESNSSTNSSNPSYGAIYWQYFENYNKITSAATPLTLRKQLFIERNTDRGPVLEEIKAENELKVGDKVKVRIVLQSDRNMEYLHLKDMRAACFEPLNVLSGYRYQGGLGYYESTRDASSNFFISYLQKGTYVFEYSVNVMAKGSFSNGISTIQCMYAPEFTSHSEGITVSVK